MDKVSIIILIGALLFIIVAAVYAIIKKDLIHSVIATSLISLALSLVFYVLQAPDVALTEAAIGIALSTIVFIITIRNTQRYENE